jgi:hypothetical protein
MFYDSINIFTDANRYNIGFGVYDTGEKKELRKKKVKESKHYCSNPKVKMAVNELDAIRYAAKYAAENYSSTLITIFTDSTNAKKMVDSVMDHDNAGPDPDRLDKDETKIIWAKIKKHFKDIGPECIQVVYTPSHCKSMDELKAKFYKNNSRNTVEEVKSWGKKERKYFFEKLRKRNDRVDRFIKKEA